MAGTKRPAEAVGFFEKKSVGERFALGEAFMEMMVDEAKVRMLA